MPDKPSIAVLPFDNMSGDPLKWGFTVVHSLTCTLLQRYDEAVELARETTPEPRTAEFWPYTALALALGNLDRTDEACAALEEAFKEKPDMTFVYLIELLPTKEPGGLDPFLDGLRKAGLTE